MIPDLIFRSEMFEFYINHSEILTNHVKGLLCQTRLSQFCEVDELFTFMSLIEDNQSFFGQHQKQSISHYWNKNAKIVLTELT